MGNIVDIIEDLIQNPILTAIDNIITPKIELALKSINASSDRDAATVIANSDRGEHIRITSSIGNVSEKNNTFHKLKANDETQGNISHKVSELSVPRTHFDRQSHTHHNNFNYSKLKAR